MADTVHLNLLLTGVDKWNQWAKLRRALESTDPVQPAQWQTISGPPPGIRPDLSMADLKLRDFTGAYFRSVDFRNAKLHKSTLVEADFFRADLAGADLSEAKLAKANLKEASLSGADLREASGFVLDSNDVRGARFSPHASDPWSLLRRGYTGPPLFFHLLLLLVFLFHT